MKTNRLAVTALGLLSIIGLTRCSPLAEPSDSTDADVTEGRTAGLDKINHFVVIYLENHSFDNMYGRVPGTEGIQDAAAKSSARSLPGAQQVGLDGKLYEALPLFELQPANFAPIANKPFSLTEGLTCTDQTIADLNCPAGSQFLNLGTTLLPDLNHNFFAEQIAIDHGRMDKFVAVNFESGALSMGYYDDGDPLPLVKEAANWTICDHFFHAAFGGSFINHQWLIAARPPEFKGTPPAELVNEIKRDASGKPLLDADGRLQATERFVIKDEKMIVNVGTDRAPKYMLTATMLSPAAPRLPMEGELGEGLPGSPANSYLPRASLQTHATIGDRLTEKKLDWAWYSGGFKEANAVMTSAVYKAIKDAPESPDGKAKLAAVGKIIQGESFQVHHQPFLYFDKYADEGAEGRKHLRDEDDFVAALATDDLPAVSFIKPVGANNEHSGYAELKKGEQHVLDLVTKIKKSKHWDDTAIIITYDEYGGFWDHVTPPVKDMWGPGARVPTIVISPYAKRKNVDKTIYDTTSILATIEKRFGLKPLTDRDKNAKDMSAAFDFTNKPIPRSK